VNKADIATAYVAGYLCKKPIEKLAESEKGSVGDLIGRYLSPGGLWHHLSPTRISSDGTNRPYSKTDIGVGAAQGLPPLSGFAYLVNTGRKGLGTMLDWKDDRNKAKTPMARAAKWMGDRPYLMAGGAALTAAAGIYAIHKKIQSQREEKEKADLEGLV